MKILICGTRNREPVEILEKIIDLFPADTVVIHGDCRGVDRTAGKVAAQRNLKVEAYPAQWNIYRSKVAGPKRNQQMLETKPDIVIALHNEPTLGTGTADMVRRSKNAGIPVFVFGC